jgi:signal peptidase I
VAEEDGEVEEVPPPTRFLHFINVQPVVVRYKGPGGGRLKKLSVWLSPDDNRFEDHTGIRPGLEFKKGEYIVKMREISGDHLFVDRVTYNFRQPRRGEIIVFETKGIEGLPQDQFYIKRLVALGGETVQVGRDDHLVIDGRRLDASTPHFENVYSFSGPRQLGGYHGHVNTEHLAPRFWPNRSVQVDSRHFMAMGDNTLNSADSRMWGELPESNVMGKYWFVYWPVSNHGASRFGWSVR